MISPTTTSLVSRTRMQAPSLSGLSRLFAAAIVSSQFRETLLQAPKIALERGYLGQTFPLTRREQALILSIRAETLTDLARQVSMSLQAGD
jgi:hypothetical protein